MGAPLFSAPGCGEREELGVSDGLGTGLSSGVAVGVGDAFLRFDFVLGVAVGDGVGEVFFRFGEAVGEGLGVGFFVERFRCLRVGAGVGVAKIFLIFVPNESSALTASIAPNNSAKIMSGPTNLRAAMDRKTLNTCLSVCHSEGSRGIADSSNRTFEAARDVSTSVDMTLCELLENCFVEANPALEIFERKIFVRRMRATIGQRKSQQQRFDAQNTAEL